MCAQRVTSTGVVVESRYTSNKRVTSIGVMVEWRPVAAQEEPGGASGSSKEATSTRQNPQSLTAKSAQAQAQSLTAITRQLTPISAPAFGAQRYRVRQRATFSGIIVRGEPMDIQAKFYLPDGTPIVQPTGTFTVERYSWMNYGGPDACQIRVIGSPSMLYSIGSGWLGYRLELLDPRARCVWYGEIDAMEINDRGRRYGVGRQSMYNSIVVHYTAPEANGTQAKTSASSDSFSTARYGTRSLIDSGSDISTLAAAEYRRDTLLSIYKLPIVEREDTGNSTEQYADIYGLGYWHRLDWSYYSDADSTSTATTTQISNIITAAGSPFNGIDIVQASGVDISEAQDGNNRSRYIVEQLLNIGTSSGGRLRATITRNRRVQIIAEPIITSTSNNAFPGGLRYDAERVLRDDHGVVLPPQTCPVGQWVTDNVTLAPRGTASLADPGAFYIEKSEYSPASGILRLQPRGQMQISDLVGIQPT